MKTQSVIVRVTALLHRYRTNMIHRRDAARVEGLPDYLLKDIGWPASTTEVCNNCTR